MKDISRNLTMLVDYYELTMANGYFQSGMKDKIAYFDVFYRENPENGGYAPGRSRSAPRVSPQEKGEDSGKRKGEVGLLPLKTCAIMAQKQGMRRRIRETGPGEWGEKPRERVTVKLLWGDKSECPGRCIALLPKPGDAQTAGMLCPFCVCAVRSWAGADAFLRLCAN